MFQATINQEKIIKRVNATVIKSGKKSLTFKMNVNEKGGFWVDILRDGYQAQSFLGCMTEQDMIDTFNRERQYINWYRSKANITKAEGIIESLLSFYN